MKTRAPRNRTVELTPDEIKSLRNRLMTKSEIGDADSIINKTINADLLEVLDLLPDRFADLIIVDPPYNLSKNYNGLNFNARTSVEYKKYLDSWFGRLCDKLKPNGSLYLCGDWHCTAQLQEVMEEHLVVRNRITWQREKGRGARQNWKNCMEDIWYGVADADDFCFNVDSVKVRHRVMAPYRVDGCPKDWNDTDEGRFRTTCPSNFWDDISVPFWSMPENTDHPTQKPEKLIAKLILASSNEGDIVFDPFLGSGTTSVAAKKLGRRYCGVELNEDYCCLAEKRLQLADAKPEIQGYADGVFWERNSGK